MLSYLSGFLASHNTLHFACYFCHDIPGQWFISGQFSRNNFHFFCHILSCIAETSKHLAKRNIGQFNHTLWPSFAQQNVLDKLNIFLRYHQIKMQKRWNSAFHHWRILIWRYLKNLFSLSKIFLWSKLGQSIQMNCPILFLIRCLLVLAVQDKMLRQWWTRSGRIAQMKEVTKTWKKEWIMMCVKVCLVGSQ